MSTNNKATLIILLVKWSRLFFIPSKGYNLMQDIILYSLLLKHAEQHVKKVRNKYCSRLFLQNFCLISLLANLDTHCTSATLPLKSTRPPYKCFLGCCNSSQIFWTHFLIIIFQPKVHTKTKSTLCFH